MKLNNPDFQSGKLGNMVVSRNRAGKFLRERVDPFDPQTARQMSHRARVTAIGGGWRALTEAQRNAWGPFGEAIGVKGAPRFNSFASVNHVRLRLGELLLMVPPAPARFDQFELTGVQATLHDDALHLALQGLKDPTPNIRYIIEATKPGSPGERRRKSELVFLDRPVTLAELQDPVALGRAYVQRHRLPAPNEAFTLSVTQLLNYQWGAHYMLEAVVTPA